MKIVTIPTKVSVRSGREERAIHRQYSNGGYRVKDISETESSAIRSTFHDERVCKLGHSITLVFCKCTDIIQNILYRKINVVVWGSSIRRKIPKGSVIARNAS